MARSGPCPRRRPFGRRLPGLVRPPRSAGPHRPAAAGVVVFFIVSFAVGWVVLDRRASGRVHLRDRRQRRCRALLGHRRRRIQLRLFVASVAGRRAGRHPVRRPARHRARRPGRRASSSRSSPSSCSAASASSAGRGRCSASPWRPHRPQHPQRPRVGQRRGNTQTGVIGAILIGSVLSATCIDRPHGRAMARSRPPASAVTHHGTGGT